MATFEYPIEVLDLTRARRAPVQALVDTGAMFTLLSGSLLRGLGITPTRTMEFTLADGRVVEREIGEAVVRIGGEETTATVIFGDEGHQAVLGAHALEGLLLAVDPHGRRLVPTRGLLM